MHERFGGNKVFELSSVFLLTKVMHLGIKYKRFVNTSCSGRTYGKGKKNRKDI